MNLQIRNNKELIIADIVEATTEKDKKNLAKLIALWVNKYKIKEMDLHALYAKRNDPTIRNYTAFVKWSIKDKRV